MPDPNAGLPPRYLRAIGGVGVIDRFLEVFTRYIDSGFGLLGGDVAFLATTLIVIDITLAALFWAWGADDDIIARLVKKTLFVGVFAYLIGNWNALARIVFESFAGLGLVAAGGSLSAAEFLQPGRVAEVGLEAGRPLLAAISELMGFVSYVVEIDRLGAAQAVGPAAAAYRPTDPQIAFHLARFIEHVRQVPADPIVLRQNWLDAYDFTTDRGALALNDYARVDDPFAKVGETQVSVDISSVIRASADTRRGGRWHKSTIMNLLDRLGFR